MLSILLCNYYFLLATGVESYATVTAHRILSCLLSREVLHAMVRFRYWMHAASIATLYLFYKCTSPTSNYLMLIIAVSLLVPKATGLGRPTARVASVASRGDNCKVEELSNQIMELKVISFF